MAPCSEEPRARSQSQTTRAQHAIPDAPSAPLDHVLDLRVESPTPYLDSPVPSVFASG